MKSKRSGRIAITTDCDIHGAMSPSWKNGTCKACMIITCIRCGPNSQADGRKKCVSCRNIRNANKLKRVRTQHGDTTTYVNKSVCPRHPQCSVRYTNNNECFLCHKISATIATAAIHMASAKIDRGPIEICIDDVRALENTSCSVCEQPVYAVEEAYAAHGFSLGRKDHSKTYTRDNIGAEHWMCNAFRHTDSISDSKRRFSNVYVLHGLNGGTLSGSMPELPIFTKETAKTRRKDVISLVAAQKRSQLRKNGKDATYMTRDYTIDLFRKQRGRCYLCGDLLGKDISYDQVIAGAGYDTDVKLTHRACNNGKGRWPLATLVDRARMVYEASLAPNPAQQ